MKRRKQGEGTIYPYRGRLAGQITIEGKRKTFYGDTTQELVDQMAAARHALGQGLPLPTGKQTLGQYLKDWLVAVKLQVKPKTYTRYGEMVQHVLSSPISKTILHKLEAKQIRALYAAKIAAGLKPSTVAMLHAVLHRALRDAVNDGDLASNKCDQVKPPRIEREEMRTLSEDQVKVLLEQVEGDRLEALYVLALTTGMRQGELLGLRWQDIDFAAGTLTIHVAAQSQKLPGEDGKEHYRMVWTTPKTASSRRTIGLLKPALEALKAHQLRQRREKLEAGTYWEGRNLVFCSHTGSFLLHNNVLTHFKRHLKAAKLPSMRFHDLRHTAITLMLSRGINPLYVSKIAGHSSVKITMAVYGHVTVQMEQHAKEIMERVFGQ